MAREIGLTTHIDPDLSHELPLWTAGLRRLAGVDEVGRGALAGPLVAAAVVLPACDGTALTELGTRLHGVRDSKTLSPRQRENLLAIIEETALDVSIGFVPAEEIDLIGVGPANRQAMERAIAGLLHEPACALLDACVLDLGLPQIGLIDGDARCLSIAAASIVAKVTRDRWMCEAHNRDPRYGFREHKGYGTAAHLAALAKYGPGPLHRRCFAPVANLTARMAGS